MTKYRIERDSMGEILVPAEHLWGAQTQRSLVNFRVGTEKVPWEIIRALIYLKWAAARANANLGTLDRERAAAIEESCRSILSRDSFEEFPLKVWQTGSGTQTNMNVNEVIAHLSIREHPELVIHPNDHVNLSQSTNDAFPTAMHVAAVNALGQNLYPALAKMIQVLRRLEDENYDVIKIGRTHLQDAVPIRFSQEISGWRGMMEACLQYIQESAESLRALAIGGTAVGTGLNCPEGFSEKVAAELSSLTGETFRSEANKFYALTSKDAWVFTHGALKSLAADLMKIANDVRLLASGPRCGIGEVTIPENEPGSSIMPGKVNPTQCEMVTMVAVQVMGNDAAIGFAASQGNFELNVFLPVLAYDMMQSIRLLSDGIESFVDNCLSGLKADRQRMSENVGNSLMLVTALSPKIGYEKAAKAARKAYEEGTTLREAVLALGYMEPDLFDETVRPESLV